MDGPLVIRDYRAADKSAVIALNMRATYLDAAPPFSIDRYPELEDLATSYQRTGAFLVGTIDGEVVTMAGVRPADGDMFEVGYMRVGSPHQKRRYARKLISSLVERASALGARSIILDTTEEQVPAQRLYESTGFEEARRSVLTNDTGAYRLIHYRRQLRA